MNLKLLITFIVLLNMFGMNKTNADVPDTVTTGIYVTSIHDIDFKQKEYTINFWLWLKYKNPDFNFLQNIEIPQAKSFIKAYSTLDTIGNQIYVLMKMQCVMKDSWKIDNFPFDRQKLRLTIENSEFDSKELIFKADTVGENHHKFSLSGWEIDSFNVTTGIKQYETAFGDPDLDKPHTEYSSYKVKIGIQRNSWGLFWKMFLGMYVSMLIAFACFFIHADNIDSRFGLSVGSLFAAIGNKYVIDSALPETSSFTLVDTLHGLTLLFILSVITISVLALKLLKENKLASANRLDFNCARVLVGVYLLLNIYFIWCAQ